MKKSIAMSIVAALSVSCGTVQSLVQSTFPYTTSVLVSSGVPANQEISTTSAATSVAQYVGASNAMVKDIRISSANISTITPSGQSLGNFRSMKVYVSGSNTGEVLVASRNDIGDNVGDNVMLDPSTSQTLDHIVKGESVKVRVAYILKSNATRDTNLRVSLRFSSVPAN
ncbi:MAG: hypothetical protein KBA33_06765 [Cloacibacterium sp.]|nr:hypothetical protein [Cloacibacterium sp.]